MLSRDYREHRWRGVLLNAARTVFPEEGQGTGKTTENSNTPRCREGILGHRDSMHRYEAVRSSALGTCLVL